MDIIDQGNNQAELILQQSLKARKPVSKIQAIGECHFCGEEFEPDCLKLFCDSGCATKHHMLYGS